MSLTAAIFDLDGTLIDSERVYQDSDREFLARHGVRLAEGESEQFVGLDSREVVRILAERHGIPGDLEAILAEKNRMFLEFAQDRVRPFPAVYRLAERLSEAGYLLAIATATAVPLREAMVELCNLDRLFPIRVSADEVERGKPSPDVYLEAAGRMSVEPANCVVIEDSQYGVKGAKAAEMTVIAVPMNHISAAFADVDLLIPGGAESVDVEEVFGWIASR